MLPTICTDFNISILYFTLHVNPRTETIQESSPPHPTVYITINGSSRSSSPIFSIRGLPKKIMAVDPTVSSTGFLLLFSSFFASTMMPTTFSRPSSRSSGCLHTALPLPRRRPMRPPGPAIGTLPIRDGRGCGLSQAIRVVERGGLDL